AAVCVWGLDGALARCNGMFAFALWDREARSLHLVRDRLGEKPLYYGRVGRRVVFGSELKALRAHPGFAPDVDRDALAVYLRLSYIPSPHTIHRGRLRRVARGARRGPAPRHRPHERRAHAERRARARAAPARALRRALRRSLAATHPAGVAGGPARRDRGALGRRRRRGLRGLQPPRDGAPAL